MIGQTLNQRYSISAQLGKGAMGTVFLAKDAQTGHDVALKLLAAGFTFDPDMIERFRREGEALKQLRHPNIVSFVDMFEWEGQQVIVMEYVPGGSLFQLIRRGPLPVDQARHITLDLCDALTRAHRLNIIHRDIKPENILLAQDGTPRLTDLGVARLIGEGTRLTGTGTQVGTPYYMSPEAWQGEHLGGQADIWSLGIVLYEMLAGQVPFGGETMVAVMNRVLTAPLPDIKSTRPDVPADLAKIVRKMLTRDKAKRYQTIREVALDLERLNVPASSVTSLPAAASVQPTIQVTQKIEPSHPPRRSMPTWVWLAVAGAVVVIVGLVAATGGLGWLVYSNQQTARQAYVTQTAIWATNQATQLALRGAASQTPELTAASQPTPAPTRPSVAPTQPSVEPTQPPAAKTLKAGLIVDQGGLTDKSFSQGTWEGMQKAAKEFGLEVQYIESKQPADYEKNFDQFATGGYDIIVASGFMMADVTAAKAKQYPNVKFAIVDTAYSPTPGSMACSDAVKDCYTDGGLKNVTSLMFQEDEVGFLAGVVAAGMSKTGTVCTVSGMEIPPVVRYVTGYQAGAKWMKPTIKTLNVYLPSFVDPALGHQNGLAMIGQGCDVLFGVGGNTGNGGLLAAKEKGLLAIGVDVDQYVTYPDVKNALLTSAMKNTDVAAYNFLKTVNDGSVKPGISIANLKNGGVGLAPYHDWDSKIPDTVKAKVQEAKADLQAGTLSTTGAAVAPASAGGATGQVTLWHAYSAGTAEEQALTKVLAAYKQANPNVTLNVLQIPFDQIFKKWETDVAAGVGPDMFISTNDSLGNQARANVLLDLTDRLQGKLDEMWPIAVDGMRVDGRIYGVPVSLKAVALYYNKSRVPSPPDTTTSLLALVKSGRKLALLPDTYFLFGFWNAYGGVPWDDSGKCVNTPAATRALAFFRDLKAADPNTFQTDFGKIQTLFRQGQVDMTVDGPWALENYRAALGDKFGVAPLPGGLAKAAPLIGVDGIFINPHSQNVSAALDLALSLTSREGQQGVVDQGAFVPSRKDVKINDPRLQGLLDSALQGYLRPQSAWLNNYWGPFGDSLTKVIEGQLSPTAGASGACADMNKANGK